MDLTEQFWICHATFQPKNNFRLSCVVFFVWSKNFIQNIKHEKFVTLVRFVPFGIFDAFRTFEPSGISIKMNKSSMNANYMDVNCHNMRKSRHQQPLAILKSEQVNQPGSRWSITVSPFSTCVVSPLKNGEISEPNNSFVFFNRLFRFKRPSTRKQAIQ